MDNINLLQKLSLFEDKWTPKIIGALNGQQVKLAKIEGDFVWHSHADEDELFLVLEGSLVMKFRDREVKLSVGEMIIVPRGVEHMPVSDGGASLLLFEPAGTAHTGDVVCDRTVNDQDWI